MVIKGPVAMAGSIPLLLRMMGTKVPINAAMMITPIIDPATVRLMTRSCWMIMPKSMRITERAKPLIRLNPTSLKSRWTSEPLTTLLAKPCTMMAEDCTPHFRPWLQSVGYRRTSFLVRAVP